MEIAMSCGAYQFSGIEAGKVYYNFRGMRVGPMRPISPATNGGYRWADHAGRLYTHCGRVFIDAVASNWDVKAECLDVGDLPPSLPPTAVLNDETTRDASTAKPARAAKPGSHLTAALFNQSLIQTQERMIKAAELARDGSGDAAVRELLAAIENITRATQLARFL